MLEWSHRFMEQLEIYPILLKMPLQWLLQWRPPLPSDNNWSCCSRGLISHMGVIICQDPDKLVLPFNKHFVHETVSASLRIHIHIITIVGLMCLEKCRQFYLCFRPRVHLELSCKGITNFRDKTQTWRQNGLINCSLLWNRIAKFEKKQVIYQEVIKNLQLCILSN